MVKKRLATGESCKKCEETEALLRRRGVWDRVDRVAWATEGDSASEGMLLARAHGVEAAPFFIVEAAGKPRAVYTSALRLIKSEFKATHSASLVRAQKVDVSTLEHELAGASPSESIRWALERWGSDAAIAFSGAEDVALIDMAAKTGLPYKVFCLDTGRLHPETYRFVEQVRTHYGIQIELMTPDPVVLEPFVRTNGLFSFYEDGHKACCGIRKVEPLARALTNCAAWLTGQRQDQSPATRAQIPTIQQDAAFTGKNAVLWKLNPLSGWSSAEVWRYIRDHEVPYNPLHERGFVSIGCEPCTRPVNPGQHEREGRWWWEESTKKECGLHLTPSAD
ncbi:MAG: phosphoadenosine phosphosulfate reductase [Myxococcota bacterium]|jgi:phosphoadenosine phosphosulfate reductase